MSTSSRSLRRKPKADTATVEDLVERVLRGLVRVPGFQRGLRWKSADVVDLFDSVHRGFPIGSLLLWERPAEAERLALGPLVLDAPETSSAWWVVDGQQRLTALAASLARDEPIPNTPDDPYVVYFDAHEETFLAPPAGLEELPSHWVPSPVLLDGARLSEWIFEWTHGRDATLRGRVFEVGRRIREYAVPLYVVATDDEASLREIFYRVNNSGRALQWGEVHDALFGEAASSPSTLEELSRELASVGMGTLADDPLLSCLVAFRGLDVTRSLAEHRRRDPDFLRGAVAEALPTLRRVLSFLRRDAEIPHLRLLPLSSPLAGLVRFFALHPEPGERTRELLVRWVWRAFLGQGYDERTLRRRAIGCVDEGDEEASAQALLGLVPAQEPPELAPPDRFDSRAAATRVALLAMASSGPRDLETGRLIDIAGLIEERDRGAFRHIVRHAQGEPSLGSGPANRILHPGDGIARDEIVRVIERGDAGARRVLESHGISPSAAAALASGDVEASLNERHQALQGLIRRLGTRLAAWGRSDRPSIQYLLGFEATGE